MLTLKERADMANNVCFIYLFVETETDTVFYVGSSKMIGRRLNEHRRDLKRPSRTPLYIYMRDHNLELFKNVEVRIVAYAKTREEASDIESEYIERYKATVTNVIKHDSRKYSTDPRYLKVRCVTTGEIFHAVKPVCEKYKVSRYLLTKAIRRGEAINGFKFEFIKV